MPWPFSLGLAFTPRTTPQLHTPLFPFPHHARPIHCNGTRVRGHPSCRRAFLHVPYTRAPFTHAHTDTHPSSPLSATAEEKDYELQDLGQPGIQSPPYLGGVSVSTWHNPRDPLVSTLAPRLAHSRCSARAGFLPVILEGHGHVSPPSRCLAHQSSHCRTLNFPHARTFLSRVHSVEGDGTLYGTVCRSRVTRQALNFQMGLPICVLDGF